MFDFAGVGSTGKLFPVIAKNLSDKFGLDMQIIQDRLYANPEPYLLGKKSMEEFWKFVCEGLPIPFDDFTKAFQAWEINQETVALIRELKQTYRVYLLSDNYEATVAYLRSQPLFQELFEKMYFSNEIHLIKGGPEIFEHVLADLQVKAEECIFIDDQEKNLTAARNLGITCILFTSAEQTKHAIHSAH